MFVEEDDSRVAHEGQYEAHTTFLSTTERIEALARDRLNCHCLHQVGGWAVNAVNACEEAERLADLYSGWQLFLLHLNAHSFR